jgi:hypothetical protein
MSDGLIKLKNLVDSSVQSSVITLNEDMKNERERQIKFNLVLEKEGRLTDLNFLCDYHDLINMNYKLKTACNQIQQAINNLAFK